MRIEFHFGDVTVPMDVINLRHAPPTITIEGFAENADNFISALVSAQGKGWFAIKSAKFSFNVEEYSVDFTKDPTVKASGIITIEAIADISKVKGE